MDKETQIRLSQLQTDVTLLRERIDRSYTLLYQTISPSGGPTAPLDAPFIMVANDARFSDERALAEGWGIDLTDAGKNSTLTITVAQADLDGRYLRSPMSAALNMGGYAITNVGDVDGVDVSALKSAYDSHILNASAHHAPVTVSDGLDLSGQDLAVDVTDFIDTAYGLTESSNNIRVNLDADGGLEFNSGATRVKLATNHGLSRSSSGLALGTPANVTVSSSNGVTTTTHTHALDLSGRTLTAGDGLTGGGTLGADRSFAVGAGDGIDVAADSVAVDVTDFIDTAYGLTEDTNNIRVNLDADGGLEFNSGAIRVKLATNHGLSRSSSGMALGTPATLTTATTNSVTTTTHAHAITTTSDGETNVSTILAGDASGRLRLDGLGVGVAPTGQELRIDGDIVFVGAQAISTTAGDLTIAPAGDLKFNPTGAQIRVMASHTLQADNYASQVTGWGITYGGSADFRYVYTDELHAKAFIADLEQALAGGQIISKSVALLSRAFTAPAAGAAATLYVKDLPSAEDMAVFQTGDIVRLRTFSRAAGSLTIADCWGVVTSYSDLSDKEQSWTFTRSAAPNAGAMSAGTVVAVDSLALDYGTSGNGFYEVNAVDGAYGVNSPYSQIVTWTTHPHSGKTVRTRLGNLYGITATTEYGLFAGEGVTAGDSYLRLTDRNFELHNLDFAMYDSSNVQRIGMDAGAGATDLLMWAGPTSADKQFAVYGDGTVWLSTLAVSAELGQSLFSQADGVLLLGPGCALTPTSWTSTRGQVATIGSTFHQVTSRWPAWRSLMIEPNTVNKVTNPVFGGTYSSGIAPGWTVGGTAAALTCTESTQFTIYGSKCQKLVFSNGASTPYFRTKPDSMANSTTYTWQMWLYIESLDTAVNVRAYLGTTISTTNLTTTGWHHVTMTATTDASGSNFIFYVYCPNNDNATVYLVGAQCEEKSYSTSLCSGDFGTGYSWNGSGTAYANTSTRIGATFYTTTIGSISASSGTISTWVNIYSLNQSGGFIFQAGDTNAEFDAYIGSAGQLHFRINGTTRCSGGYGTIAAGESYLVTFTWDVSADESNLYINGSLLSSGVVSGSPTLGTYLGIGYAPIIGTKYDLNGSISEFAVFGRVLTADEIASIYASGNPLTDMGALKNPGIYVLDGKFDLRSATTGARVQIDANGVSGYSAATTQTFSLATDGDLFVGSDISAVGTTALAVFANAQTYNSESMGAGDVLLGDNSAGKINLLWDVSEGDIILRRGNGAGAARITLDGSADSILIGQAAASQNNVLISSGAISIRNNTTERIGLTAAGILTIKDSAGNAVITLDASTGAEITKKLTLPGDNSAIAIGSTPPTAHNAGTGIWIDRTGLFALDAGTYQVKVDATDGKLYAGAGNIFLDSDGVSVALGTGRPNGVCWVDGIYVRGKVWTYAPSAVDSYINVGAFGEAGGSGYLMLTVSDNDFFQTETVTLSTSMLSSSVPLDVTGDVWCSGQISTDGGTTQWDLGAYSAGAPTADGYVSVVINGSTYKLLCDKV